MPNPDAEKSLAEQRLTVRLAQAGDPTAFRQLVELYDRRLFYFVRRIVGEVESAFDVLQAVWLQVHRQLRRLSAPEAFRVWLYRIAHNQAIQELRRKTRLPVSVEELDQSPQPAEVTDEQGFDNAELVHVALQRLSVDHRRILTLRFLEDMTVAEIADVIDCAPGTVSSRLHYARLALRERIKELVDD